MHPNRIARDPTTRTGLSSQPRLSLGPGLRSRPTDTLEVEAMSSRSAELTVGANHTVVRAHGWGWAHSQLAKTELVVEWPGLRSWSVGAELTVCWGWALGQPCSQVEAWPKWHGPHDHGWGDSHTRSSHLSDQRGEEGGEERKLTQCQRGDRSRLGLKIESLRNFRGRRVGRKKLGIDWF